MKVVFVLFFCTLLSVGWLARPWASPDGDANAPFRGTASALIVGSSDCQSLTPDGRFDWRSVSSDEGFETCLITVAGMLKTPEAMVDWLASQGFVVLPAYDGVPPVARMVGAEWPAAGNPAVYPYDTAFARVSSRISQLITSLGGLPLLVPARGYQIVISYASDGTIIADAGAIFL